MDVKKCDRCGKVYERNNVTGIRNRVRDGFYGRGKVTGIGMTESKVKEYLNQYGIEKDRLDILNERIEEYRLSKMFPSVINDGMPHSSNQSDLSSYAAKLTDMEAKRDEQREKCKRLRSGINHNMECLSGKEEWIVLQLRYINVMDWKRISEIMKCCESKVMKLHKKAINEIKSKKSIDIQ